MLELTDLARRYGAFSRLTYERAARIYSGAVLRTGTTVKLRDAWPASRSSVSARG